MGATVARKLFAGAEPVGSTVRVAYVPMTVAGVLAGKGASGSGRNQDDVVFVPMSTARLRLVGSAGCVRRDAVDDILVKSANSGLMESAS